MNQVNTVDDYQVWPGGPYPLGPTYDGTGTNFASFSDVAEEIEPYLINAEGEETRIKLEEVDAYIWRCYIPSIMPSQHYAYHTHDPFDPANGRRCDPNKLLVDPYAKAFDGEFDGHSSPFNYGIHDHSKHNTEDSPRHTMASVVINSSFGQSADHVPHMPYNETVIYEAHVKGMAMTHLDTPEEIRSTYAALAYPAVIDYLKDLGVTAIELMPVHQSLRDNHLREKGLRDYWGYNTFGFLAPHRDYSASQKPGGTVSEFKDMVHAFHGTGIEIILDVVYNHTAEGSYMGPAVCLRGTDNEVYYHLVKGDRQHYMDYTGTGNSLNMRHPHPLQLVMDSLRYWVPEMHADGFRLDLAPILAQEFHDVDRPSAFFNLVQQSPTVNQVKLAAESWDVGEGGCQVDNFPSQWTEWNGKYRDTIRDFQRGEPSTLGELASRVAGSSNLCTNNGRRPTAPINFVTVHDDSILNDLASCNEKHNMANGGDNRDDESHNRPRNCGVEGPADDECTILLCAHQRRNFLTILLLSQDTPMISHGDEIGRGQRGSNNVHCQDNRLSQVGWNRTSINSELIEYTQFLTELRAEYPVFRRRRFLRSGPLGAGADDRDIAWPIYEGRVMATDDWSFNLSESLIVWLNGDAIVEPDRQGHGIEDDPFLPCFNVHYGDITFQIPSTKYARSWEAIIDTTEIADHPTRKRIVELEDELCVPARSTIMLIERH